MRSQQLSAPHSIQRTAADVTSPTAALRPSALQLSSFPADLYVNVIAQVNLNMTHPAAVDLPHPLLIPAATGYNSKMALYVLDEFLNSFGGGRIKLATVGFGTNDAALKNGPV